MRLIKQVGNKKQVMPPGYSLCVSCEELCYWVIDETGKEGLPSWDRWRCYRDAWSRYRAYRYGPPVYAKQEVKSREGYQVF